MSYDLFFTTPTISRPEFQDYFQSRKNYRLEGSAAIYESAVTGVYFSFEHYETTGRDKEDDEDYDYSVAFNMNYFRPPFFALEAEPEISAFVAHFDCTVADPQGDENAGYSPEAMIRGWNHGNKSAHRAFLKLQGNPDTEIPSRPAAELEAIWRWNYRREDRTQAMVEDIFIPRILFAVFDGELCSFCIWPDAIPALIPAVDRIWIPRSEHAPRRFFSRPKDDRCLIPFATAQPVLKPYRVGGYEFDAYKLPLDVPRVLVDFVRKLSPMQTEPEGVSMDQVLAEELVDEARLGQ